MHLNGSRNRTTYLLGWHQHILAFTYFLVPIAGFLWSCEIKHNVKQPSPFSQSPWSRDTDYPIESSRTTYILYAVSTTRKLSSRVVLHKSIRVYIIHTHIINLDHSSTLVCFITDLA